MKVIVKKVSKDPKVIEISDKLEEYQRIVGGYIEVFPFYEDILCICNEEGKLKGLQPNFMFRNDIICGDVIFISASGPDFVGLNDVQIDMLNIILK